MQRTAVLHIGMHKTGSTSVQNALRGYDDGSVFYATFEEPNHSIRIFTAFRTNFEDYHVWKSQGLSRAEISKKRDVYRQNLSRMLQRRDRDRIVISGEDIGNLTIPEKHALLEFFDRHGWTVNVVCYVREPTHYAASVFQEGVKHRDRSIPNLYRPHYKSRLSGFLSELPKHAVCVRPFEPSQLKDGDVVSDFCARAGIYGAVAKELRSNQSMSFNAARLLFNFNMSGVLTTGDASVTQAFKKFQWQVVRSYAGQGRARPGLFQDFADYSEVDWLRSEFGIKFESMAQDHQEIGLLEKLSDLSDIDLAGLNQALENSGLRPQNYPDAVQKMQRIYFDYLSKEPRNGGEQTELQRVEEERNVAVKDLQARKSRVAFWIDYLDFCVHRFLSRVSFFGERFQNHFLAAAERRHRSCYDSRLS